MGASATVNAERVNRAMRMFPDRFARELRFEMFTMGKDHRVQVARGFSRKARSRRRAFFWVLDRLRQYRKGRTLGELVLGSFTRSPALLAHETGAVIRPKRGGHMFIPTGDALTPTGLLRRRYAGADGQFSLKSDPRAQVIKVRGRPMAVVIDEEQGEVDRLLAVGVKRARIDPTLGFFRTWDKLNPRRIRSLNRAADRTLAAVGAV